MDKKKLFGMIIGVTMFGVLVAGATFAWLTFGVTVGDNVLTANTLNFVVTYETGSAVTNLPVLDSNYIEAKDAAAVSLVLKKNPTSPEGHASIWLNTTSDTKMTKDSVVRYVICRDEDIESGADLVEGKQVDDTCGDKIIMQNDAPVYAADGVLMHGIITGTGPVPLLSDARIADDATKTGTDLVAGCSTSSGLSMCTGTSANTHLILEDGVSYFVYMWLEAEPLVNAHLDEQYQKTGSTDQYKVGQGGTPDYDAGIKFNLYDGYVFASATQLQD